MWLCMSEEEGGEREGRGGDRKCKRNVSQPIRTASRNKCQHFLYLIAFRPLLVPRKTFFGALRFLGGVQLA